MPIFRKTVKVKDFVSKEKGRKILKAAQDRAKFLKSLKGGKIGPRKAVGSIVAKKKRNKLGQFV